MRDTTLLKQYGAKRSGTCYLWQLVMQNFEGVRVLTNALGWKHGLPVDPAEWLAGEPVPVLTPERVARVGYLVSVKDPYAWLVSICRFEHGGRYGEAAALVASLNERYAAWVQMPRSRVVRYERLLSDLAGELRELGEQFGLRRSMAVFRDEWRVVRPGESVMPVGFKRRDWYLERQYMDALTDEAREAVTAGVDWDLFGRMGYEPCRS